MKDQEFDARRENAIQRINSQDAAILKENPQRDAFFESVYETAEGDAALVPWADLEPKPQLSSWLNQNPGKGKRAIDIGCGLGDNAEAISSAGYSTLGFDFSDPAVEWAKKRFPNSGVEYRQADLFELPEAWGGAFDLVHECYTLQSIPPETLDQSIPATASLVAAGGTLLVYTRVRDDNSTVDGPPWPLEERRVASFSEFGLVLQSDDRFILEKGARRINLSFAVWRKGS